MVVSFPLSLLLDTLGKHPDVEGNSCANSFAFCVFKVVSFLPSSPEFPSHSSSDSVDALSSPSFSPVSFTSLDFFCEMVFQRGC